MATKTIVRVSPSDSTVPGKVPAEPVAKLESDEETRRRRAGIACFL